ncbi:MAG TPA: hypothetical protein VG939_04355 [Caulobacteraceae bacterium]|nr:hypothetical protein [Caulobacteraceae bacterium]
MSRAAIGFRASRGGAVAVAVAGDVDAPAVVISTFLATAAEGDRLAFEPYHLAAEMAHAGEPSPDIVAAVAEARRRQDALAESGLRALLERLQDAGHEPAVAALLVNRAGWLTEVLRLAHSLSSPEHPPVIEGLAVRDALRFAFGRCGLSVAEMDEKTLSDTAAAVLGLTPGVLDARLKAFGAAAGKPWRKEQKSAAVAAWLALAAR